MNSELSKPINIKTWNHRFFVMINNLVFYIAIIIASLFVLIKASDYLVYGISHYAKRLGLSDYLIGFVVVGLATTVPEFVPAILGIYYDNSGIIVGTILGSAFCSISLMLGTMGIVGKKVKTESKLLHGRRFLIPILTILPVVLLWDNLLSRFEGFILILLYLIFLGSLWKKEGRAGRVKEKVFLRHLMKPGIIFLGCLVAILIVSRLLVDSALKISDALNIPSFIIALLVIGVGTSLPDLTVQLRAIKHGHADVGMGNVLGGIICEMLLLLGLIAVIKPIVIPFMIVLPIAIVFFASVLLAMYFTRRGIISWKHGIILILIYLLFIIGQLVFG